MRFPDFAAVGIAGCLGLGFIKFAPGTFGALAGAGLYCYYLKFCERIGLSDLHMSTGHAFLIGVIFLGSGRPDAANR